MTNGVCPTNYTGPSTGNTFYTVNSQLKTWYNPPTDNNVLVINSSNTNYRGPYIVMNGSQETSTPGAAGQLQLRYGDFTQAAPATSGFDISYANNGVLTSVLNIDSTLNTTVRGINQWYGAGFGTATYTQGTGITGAACLSGSACDSHSGTFTFSTGASVPALLSNIVTVTLGGVARPYAAVCSIALYNQSTGALVSTFPMGTTTTIEFESVVTQLTPNTNYTGTYICN
jgi:hypothetical protein